MSEKKEFEPLDVGATERVDWKVAQGLSKYVHFDENGNAVIGNNIEVGGAIKVNGGFKAIAQYQLNNGTLSCYGNFEGQTDIFSILGFEDDTGMYECIGLGTFSVSNQRVEFLSMAGYDFYNDNLMHFSLKNDGTVEGVSYAKTTNTQG